MGVGVELALIWLLYGKYVDILWTIIWIRWDYLGLYGIIWNYMELYGLSSKAVSETEFPKGNIVNVVIDYYY